MVVAHVLTASTSHHSFGTHIVTLKFKFIFSLQISLISASQIQLELLLQRLKFGLSTISCKRL